MFPLTKSCFHKPSCRESFQARFGYTKQLKFVPTDRRKTFERVGNATVISFPSTLFSEYRFSIKTTQPTSLKLIPSWGLKVGSEQRMEIILRNCQGTDNWTFGKQENFIFFSPFFILLKEKSYHTNPRNENETKVTVDSFFLFPPRESFNMSFFLGSFIITEDASLVDSWVLLEWKKFLVAWSNFLFKFRNNFRRYFSTN